jgi:hypothetical protein
MRAPVTESIMSAMLRRRSQMSKTWGLRAWRRAKARSWPVSLAARSTDGRADDGQQVVEVVRDAAGELADRFQLLGLPQGFLGMALLGDVAPEAVEQPVLRHDGPEHPPPVAVAGHARQLDILGPAALTERPERRQRRLAFRGDDEIDGFPAQGLVLGPAQRPAPGWINRLDLPVLVRDELQHRRQVPDPVAVPGLGGDLRLQLVRPGLQQRLVPVPGRGAAPALEQAHEGPGEALQDEDLRPGQVARLGVENAERADRPALGGDERDAGVEAQARRAQAALQHQGARMAQGPDAQVGVEWPLLAVLADDRRGPEPVGVDEADPRHRRAAGRGRHPGDVVEHGFRRDVENGIAVQRCEALGVMAFEARRAGHGLVPRHGCVIAHGTDPPKLGRSPAACRLVKPVLPTTHGCRFESGPPGADRRAARLLALGPPADGLRCAVSSHGAPKPGSASCRRQHDPGKWSQALGRR